MEISNNKILITGGASGIGLGLTERFLKENNTVIVCGRREAALNEIAEQFPSVITRKCDLSVAEERQALYDWIAEEHSDLNVLVNNAGIQQWISVFEGDFYQRAKEELAINVEAPLRLSALFVSLKSLTAILNVSSGLGFVPLANVAVYSATKSFFHSFTISLRHQLKSRNIEVIELIPPALNSDLGGVGLHDYAPPVSGYVDAVFEQLKEQKLTISYGQSLGMMSSEGADDLQKIFERMNPSS